MRTKEYKKNKVWESAWVKTMNPLTDQAINDFKTWPLYEKLGTPWNDSPKRYVPAKDMDEVYRIVRLNDSSHQLFQEDSISVLYHNLSLTLNNRQAFHSEHFQRIAKKRLTVFVKNKTREFERRHTHQIQDRWRLIWDEYPIYCLQMKVWETLHSDLEGNDIRADFINILQAGFLPLKRH